MKETLDCERFRDPSTEFIVKKKMSDVLITLCSYFQTRTYWILKGSYIWQRKSIMRTGNWKLKSEIQNGHNFSNSDSD